MWNYFTRQNLCASRCRTISQDDALVRSKMVAIMVGEKDCVNGWLQ
jgi:hypothetical protein